MTQASIFTTFGKHSTTDKTTNTTTNATTALNTTTNTTTNATTALNTTTIPTVNATTALNTTTIPTANATASQGTLLRDLINQVKFNVTIANVVERELSKTGEAFKDLMDAFNEAFKEKVDAANVTAVVKIQEESFGKMLLEGNDTREIEFCDILKLAEGKPSNNNDKLSLKVDCLDDIASITLIMQPQNVTHNGIEAILGKDGVTTDVNVEAGATLIIDDFT